MYVVSSGRHAWVHEFSVRFDVTFLSHPEDEEKEVLVGSESRRRTFVVVHGSGVASCWGRLRCINQKSLWWLQGGKRTTSMPNNCSRILRENTKVLRDFSYKQEHLGCFVIIHRMSHYTAFEIRDVTWNLWVTFWVLFLSRYVRCFCPQGLNLQSNYNESEISRMQVHPFVWTCVHERPPARKIGNDSYACLLELSSPCFLIPPYCINRTRNKQL